MEGIFMTQQTVAFLLSIVAFGIAIRETLRYRERARNEYSDYSMLEINWLWQFVFVMIPIAFLWGAESYAWLERFFHWFTGFHLYGKLTICPQAPRKAQTSVYRDPCIRFFSFSAPTLIS